MSTTQDTASLIGQRQIRIDKIKELRELGIDPFPPKSNRSISNSSLAADFEQNEGKIFTVAGRVMTFRHHGKLAFVNIQDPTGQIQLYIKEEDLETTSPKTQSIGFEHLYLFDIGDFIEATGVLTKTKSGEISIQPQSIRMLVKAIRPLPEKHSGLKDEETIFRQRYLDMIMNPDNRFRFQKRAEITFAIREFLNKKGFLEIKTPILQPVYGGTNANPFKTKVNALNSEFYLAIAHELYLKRLIVAGYENVYNIVGYFRNEGIDRSHNPEFEMLETMTAYQNYEYNMDLTEDMYKYIAEKVFNKYEYKIGGKTVDISKKWERIDMIDAVKKYASIDFNSIDTLEEAHKALLGTGFNEELPKSIGECMVAVFEQKVEELLIEPTFITGHPVEISPLAKTRRDDPRFVERFEVFMGGIEQGDNWTEENDPIKLYENFKEQVKKGRGGDTEAHPMDVEFLEALEHGLPPTTGLGPGIDRMTMTLTETDYIDDVIFFPMMKPSSVTQTQKEIYGKDYVETKVKSLNDNDSVKTPQTAQIETTNKAELLQGNVQDLSRKFVLLLNKEVSGWQLTNTVGHLTAYLGAQVGSKNITFVDSFETADEDKSSLICNSQYPVVALEANPGQLYNFLLKVEEAGLVHLAYVQEMIETSNDLELKEIFKTKKRKDLTYLGIGVFGLNEEIDSLTKKFKLWTGN